MNILVKALAAPFAARFGKKRKEVDYTSNTTPDAPGPSIKRSKKGAKPSRPEQPTQSKNTAVYVTGLPPDTTAEELAARFSKCGLLMEDDDEQPKIKLYAFEDGTFNGEALVVYFQEDSVMLALNLLDEAELRLGDSSTRMSVKRGEFGHKGGENTNTVRRVVDKKKATKRIVRMKKFVPCLPSYLLRPLRLLTVVHHTVNSLTGTQTMTLAHRKSRRSLRSTLALSY